MPDPVDDAVQLTDLEVIQQFSLAVRGATAPRDTVIRALETDLAWLRGTTTAPPAEPVLDKPAPKSAPRPAKKAAVRRREA